MEIDTPFETEIEVTALLHKCPGLQFIAFDDLSLEESPNGYKVATIQEVEGHFFFKATGRRPKDVFIKEVVTLHNISHPNIVALKACVINEDKKVVGFLTEYAENGDLHDHYHSPTNLKQAWILQLVDALSYLQKEGIEYHDIKPRNLVIVDGKLKMIDFDGGYSRGYYKKGFDCFPLAIILEDLGFPGAESLVEEAKSKQISFDTFRSRFISLTC
ncbi:hypothetical protein M422DRAFT_49272 [Sphaerobolus stellatus SS14]|uniref:Protein kinase domain-containing protein n=1 Tax=Sphaerobolus stellatus (strain SS14) TaxID=990650 RepID=A0A0C9VQC3_SPHS4|nr:hypothetical protein M422DRAFT_49272 [Sphaerobolus stellatus SS14]